MFKFSSRKMIKAIFCIFFVFILYGGVSWAYTSILNYHGYCSVDGPMKGVRLNKKERLDIAVGNYLHNQILMDFNEIELAENGGKRSGDYFKALQHKFSLIPYSNKSDFYQANQGCCELTNFMVEGDNFGFWERAEGSGDGMFMFEHNVRFKNKDGVIKEIRSSKTYWSVSNCGYPDGIFFN